MAHKAENLGQASAPKPILILSNAKCLASRGLSFEDLIGVMAQVGLDASVELLDPDTNADDWVDAHAGAMPSVVVAAGGDGTIHHVANLIAGLGVPMGILPLGTANDFARSLGLPLDLVEAARVIAERAPLPIDLGRVNGHFFLNAAHLGLGVETAKRTNLQLKQVIGPLAYVWAAWQAWRETTPMPVEIVAEGQSFHLMATQLLIGNGKFFGGGNVLARDATLDDGLFDVHVLGPQLGATDVIKMAAAIRMGTLGDHPDTMYFRTNQLSVRLTDSAELNLDGELMAMGSRLDFDVVPRALSVYALVVGADPLDEPSFQAAGLI